MPFSQLPSSPGFVQPQAPRWEPFAAQANEFIQRGGEMRMKAGEDLVNSIDKAAAQIDAVIKEQSPEGKARRRMQMIQTQALTQLYEDFKLHPEKYQMTAHGPILKDPWEQALKIQHLRSAMSSADLNEYNLIKKKKDDALSTDLDAFRNKWDSFNAGDLPDATSGIPPGTEGSNKSLSAPTEADRAINEVNTIVPEVGPFGVPLS